MTYNKGKTNGKSTKEYTSQCFPLISVNDLNGIPLDPLREKFAAGK